MKRFRKVVFWCHLLTGVTAGAIILLMSVTGVLLAFEPQVIRWAEGPQRTVRPPESGGERLGAETLLARLLEARPDAKPTGLTLYVEPSAAASVALGREATLFLDPYSGQIQGDGAQGPRRFFRAVMDWHRWLGIPGEGRAVGRAITGVCNAAFLLLAVSGLYLWWPRQWSRQRLAAVTVFQRGLRGRARDFNWHNVIGFWCAPVLIGLTSTGLVISYPWASNLIYTLTGSEPPPSQPRPAERAASQPAEPTQSRPQPAERTAERPASPSQAPDRGAEPPFEVPENLDTLWASAEKQAPGWRSITLRLPQQSPGAALTFSIDEGGSWNPLARSQLSLDPATGQVMKWEPYSGFNLGRRLRSWVRPVHTGEALGLPGQILACLASLGGSFLVYTGLSLAWRRFRSWRRASAAVLIPLAQVPE